MIILYSPVLNCNKKCSIQSVICWMQWQTKSIDPYSPARGEMGYLYNCGKIAA